MSGIWSLTSFKFSQPWGFVGIRMAVSVISWCTTVSVHRRLSSIVLWFIVSIVEGAELALDGQRTGTFLDVANHLGVDVERT